jgi:hypothetical protein
MEVITNMYDGHVEDDPVALVRDTIASLPADPRDYDSKHLDRLFDLAVGLTHCSTRAMARRHALALTIDTLDELQAAEQNAVTDQAVVRAEQAEQEFDWHCLCVRKAVGDLWFDEDCSPMGWA